MTKARLFSSIALSLLCVSSVLLACGSDDAASSSGGATGDACNTLCTGAKFTGGKATDFGGGVIECVCTGTGGTVAKADCETYCGTNYKVAPAKSFVSKQVVDNDKCVCDGT